MLWQSQERLVLPVVWYVHNAFFSFSQPSASASSSSPVRASPARPSIVSAPVGGGGSAATRGAAAAGRGGGTPYNDFPGIGIDPSFSGDLFNLGAQPQRQLPDVVNITINAAVAEASLGQTIVDALTDYNRRSGPLDLQIAV